MTHPLPWFPCYPSKLLGALSGMKPDEGYVYWIVCLRIYETGHACRDTIDAIARRSGMNRKRVDDALNLSFLAGRLVRDNDGIMNPFAASVMAEASALRAERSRAGQKGANARWEKIKENQTEVHGKPMPEPMAKNDHLQVHLHKNKEPKKVLRSISEDWILSEKGLEFATSRGWSVEHASSEAERFKNHGLASGKKYRDFEAAWRNWVTSPFQDTKRREQQPKRNFADLHLELQRKLADEERTVDLREDEFSFGPDR